ncbi:heterokaryon incompatibility protein-domain-containing protein [Pisolithus marmoratus]|nr:heterokaryon incompatibility protein-domain-containing protein [Pisolithus marmoratus]
MRVIDVYALLEVDFHGSAILAGSPYAILSHCWDVPENGEKEVHFRDIKKFTTMKPSKRDEIRSRDGYRKILDTCRRAKVDGLRWAWVDTCCINRESSSELSEAINSMFRWYANSRICYVYFQDVEGTLPTEREEANFPESGGWPKWFTRGWTLQELVAPRTVHFFDRDWKFIGDKQDLADTLKAITRIPRSVLKHGIGSPRPSAAQILSWAADRRTTRVEDVAYSLLGLLDVNMPMLYGEGKKAFQRLQEEIIRRSNDHSIFAWDPDGKGIRTTSVLADDPSYFRGCHNIKKVEFDEFIKELKEEEEPNQARLQMFSVTNGGIQIWLPLTPYHDCPSIFRATLACHRYGTLVTIDLAPWKTKHYRYCGVSGTPKSHPVIQQLFLAHHDDVHDDFKFELDCRTIAYHDFSCCFAFPFGVTNGSVTLTRSNPLTVLMYHKDCTYFAVTLGWCFGQEWVHVKPGTYMKENGHDWEDYAKEIYHQAWNMGSKHAHLMAEANSGHSLFYLKHAHVLQSSWAVKIICGAWKKPRKSMVTIDIGQCTGLCCNSLEWRGLKLQMIMICLGL